ncbi:hypothetical protein F4859DRAFT_524762 [Xylaria cf. heliscus]|nr:hypothetical protein F4859DRAFT_524762 [Xylaria cf. heliscus]
MWPWVPDRMVNDQNLGDANNTMVQNLIYVACRLLIKSTSPSDNNIGRRSAKGFDDFQPMPATTSNWSKVTYTNDESNEIETVGFPSSMSLFGPSIGESARWRGDIWYNEDNYGGDSGNGEGGNPRGPDNKDYGEADTTCLSKTPLASTKTSTTTESRLTEGRPKDNRRGSHHSVKKTTNAQTANIVSSACGTLSREGIVLANPPSGVVVRRSGGSVGAETDLIFRRTTNRPPMAAGPSTSSPSSLSSPAASSSLITAGPSATSAPAASRVGLLRTGTASLG